MKKRSTLSIQRMVLAAILTSLIIVMSFTPLGYLKIGTVEITFIMIPVAIGAILLGEWWGLFFGGVFGATSFIQCFGYSLFGTALMSINPVFTFLLCVIPRLLVGYLTGLIYKAISKVDKKKYIAVLSSSVSAAVINTLFFTILFVLFFSSADLTSSALQMDFSKMTILDLVFLIITTNALIEIFACGVIGAAVSRVIIRFIPDFSGGKK